MVNRLNNDQLDGLANLCFDLAKGVFGFSLLPATNLSGNLQVDLLKIILGLFTGLAFTYAALLILKVKEKALK